MTVKLTDPVVLAPGWQISTLGPIQSDGVNLNRIAYLPLTIRGNSAGLFGISGHFWLGSCHSVLIKAGDRSITLSNNLTPYPEFGMTANTNKVYISASSGCENKDKLLIYSLKVRHIYIHSKNTKEVFVSIFLLALAVFLIYRLINLSR